jgi:spore coat protein CotH
MQPPTSCGACGNNSLKYKGFGTEKIEEQLEVDFSKYKNQRVDGRNKLVLKCFKDDSNYVREIYSYDLFERFGIWTAPKASYCRVQIKIKGDANPAYYGVYEMIESVDEDFIAKRQQNWTNQIGFLWKAGWSGSDNADFVHSTSIGVEDVKLNPANSLYYAYDLKTREDEIAAAKTDLQQFIADLNSKNDAEFQTWINQKMDID